MDVLLQARNAVENEIRAAFRGVKLGRGISLRQAQLIDQDVDGNLHSESPTSGETTDDWARVSRQELERDCIAHLDALGFRYYIPALMLDVLDYYDPSSMRVIGTLAGLYPKKNDSWEYHMQRYSLLNAEQKTAIAQFLAELPKLVELDVEDRKIVERALLNYWRQYLQTRNF